MSPISGWRNAMDAILNLVFPPHCVACGRGGDWLCPQCIAGIEYLKPPLCASCGQPLPRGILCHACASRPLEISGIRAVAYLTGAMREAIHHFKYKGARVLAPYFGDLLAETWRRAPWRASVVVPVPLHPRRLRQRGYNQSALLARELGGRVDLPVVEGCLLRLRPTRPQVGLGAEERIRNVQDAFGCSDARMADTDILLVDDVCTTGATLEACTRALLASGVRSVWALTLAREKAPSGLTTHEND